MMSSHQLKMNSLGVRFLLLLRDVMFCKCTYRATISHLLHAMFPYSYGHTYQTPNRII